MVIFLGECDYKIRKSFGFMYKIVLSREYVVENEFLDNDAQIGT